MPFDVQILEKKIEGIKQAFENGKFSDALLTSLNTGSGLMQQRIFQQNEDISGNSFGKYIGKIRKARLIVSANRTQNKRNKAVAGKDLTPYQIKRARAGRQTSKKDLEFHGGLRRAIETQVESENAAILEFNNDLAAKIARGQENQITNIRTGGKGSSKGNGIKIFRLNEKEKEQVVEQGIELIKQILKP